NELYFAAYEIETSGWRETQRLRLASMDEARARVEGGETVVGPEVAKWFASGLPLFPDAAILGQLAARRNDFLSGEKLEPIYLRETAFIKAPPPRVILSRPRKTPYVAGRKCTCMHCGRTSPGSVTSP